MAKVTLRVDGETVEAEPGLTLAAVLWNLGRWQLRSSVSGPPRGPLCGMGVCFECRATINGQWHARTCQTLCEDGMEVRTDE